MFSERDRARRAGVHTERDRARRARPPRSARPPRCAGQIRGREGRASGGREAEEGGCGGACADAGAGVAICGTLICGVEDAVVLGVVESIEDGAQRCERDAALADLEKARAAEHYGLEAAELLRDIVAREPVDEALEGGSETLGDFEERPIGIGEFIEEVGAGAFVGLEGRARRGRLGGCGRGDLLDVLDVLDVHGTPHGAVRPGGRGVLEGSVHHSLGYARSL